MLLRPVLADMRISVMDRPQSARIAFVQEEVLVSTYHCEIVS
jgi:hypothetical protein